VRAPDPSLDPPATVVRRLVGAPITELAPIGGGRNSRVYRVRSRGSTFALKQYPSRLDDAHDRLGTEVDALRLMRQHQLDAVPDVIAVDRDHGLALLSWINGSPVTAVSTSDVDQAVTFLAAVDTLRQACAFAEQRHAAEACLSGAEIERQIDARLKRLQELPVGEESLHTFLQVSFRPIFDRLIAQARGRMCANGNDFDTVLVQEQRSLVPSDFGFHNSLRRPDGTLAFFDFEYFGWDDPVKLTADVLLHPGTPIMLPQREQFRRAAECLYGRDPTFCPRLNALYPLFGLRWTLIVLNEFLPDCWRRRVMAGAGESWTTAKQKQLARAYEYVSHLASEELQEASYGE
jgi:Phosphotransferase enzyme family